MSVCRTPKSCLLLIVTFALAGAWSACGLAAEQGPKVTKELRERAVAAMRQTMAEQEQWVKVHAAEYLIALDYPQGVGEAFEKELAERGTEPKYRIGIWRVLARLTNDHKVRAKWVGKIREAFLDLDGPDRLHAAETLGKLGYVPKPEGDEQFAKDAEGADEKLKVYVRFVVANAGTDEAVAGLARSLESADARGSAAYGFRYLESLPGGVLAKLTATALKEPASSPARVYLLSAAFVHAPAAWRAELKAPLLDYLANGTDGEKREACEALGRAGEDTDVPALIGLLGDPSIDVRATAAYAILRIGRRVPQRMAGLDWWVIGAYALGMLLVGWYYSRRTKTTEDYLLGGRKMRPLAVGLSLFATMLSTISYLSRPGEIIKHGPMVLFGIASYPFIAAVVGWLLIPFFMKLRVTSAYEILERRLGLGARMVGSGIFLALRLMWMAVIIYATTSKVLVPMMGLDDSATPYICAVLGFITVIYTSMGGLRAVVFTDVVQTLILFAGAILTMVLITVHLGGVGAWWPTEWAAHWQKPAWGYDPTVRISFVGIVIANFAWWVCTAGSDQMAIQRYLATRDAKAARRVLFTSLTSSALIGIFLSVVGLALLAYFQANPHFVPDGHTIVTDADRLFPRFILIALPAGISGLVVAGLLAAAMSSLSSGVNSSSSVITVDFVDRFRRKAKLSETEHVRLAKWMSVFVGVVVVFLSSFVGVVQGNLLTVAYKVVNLLTAPLFGLFFMAMFVRWSTGFGSLVGSVVGVGVAVTISYWEELTGAKGISFIWAMPLSLIAQVAVGSLVSLLPIGQRRPPLTDEPEG